MVRKDVSKIKTLVEAIKLGDTDLVRSMITAEPALLAATDDDAFGATALIHAVGTESREMVDLLLDLGADIDQRSDWWAGSFGVLDSASDDLFQRLLDRGATLTAHAAARTGRVDDLRAMLDADPSLASARGGDGQTPLHFAGTVGVADLLLSRGADIEALDIDHASTPAQWLASTRPEISAHLVSRGATPDPFMAVRIGDVALLEKCIRIEPEGVHVRVSRKRFPVKPPAAGHIYLFTIGEGCGLLHAAASANKPDPIRWLTAHGADPMARGGYDDATPLHLAAWEDAPEAIAALLDAGAEIDVKSGPMHKNEPIGWAIVGGSARAFHALRARGASLRPHHREDIQRGVEGAFRHLNPKRPLRVWREIADAMNG